MHPGNEVVETQTKAEDSYQSENSSIRNIIADWDAQPELADAIAGLGLQPWRNRLEEANTAFADKYRLRSIESGSATAESLRLKRLETNDAYYQLRDDINSYYNLTRGAEPYKTVVASFNGSIGFYNDTMARRGGGDKKDAAAVTTPGA